MAEATDSTEVIHDVSDGTPPSPTNTPLGDTTAPKGVVSDSGSALDALMKEVTKDETPPAGDDGENTEPTADEKAAEEKRIADEKAVADKAAADKAAADKGTGGGTPAAGAPVEEPKDKFAEVKLPPHSKPASVEAFNRIKQLGRETETRLTKEINELKAKIPADGGLTAETKKELEDLRAFRKVHEGQNHADFKKTYEEPISSNEATILAKLKAAGFDDAKIAKVKEIGVSKLDWDQVLPTLPTVTRRAIEAKLLENETLAEKREAALAEIQKAPQAFTAKQQQESEAAKNAEQATIVSTLDKVVANSEFSKTKEVPANATPAQKAEIEAHNKFAKEQADRRAILLADQSPEMRGQTVAATLLAYQFKRDADSYKAKFEAASAELEKVKKSSSTARRSSSAPAASTTPVASTSLLTPGAQALDALAAAARNAD